MFFFLPFLISRQEVYFYNNFLKTNLMVLEFIYLQQEIYSSFITNRQGRGGGGVKQGSVQNPFSGVHACTRTSNKVVH